MDNTNNSQSINSQSEVEYPHFIFSFARKDYTTTDLLTFFSADLLNINNQRIILPPQLPFAAFPVSKPTLILLINAVPSFSHYKIFHCDNFPTLGPQLTSELRPPISNLSVNNPISSYQSQAKINQTRTQKRQQQFNTQTLLPYSCVITISTLQQPSFTPAPPGAPQSELINSTTPQFST